MIDEDSDDSEDIIISPNSPACSNDVSHESNIISDYSSPLKNEDDIIIETNSPEINEEKHLKSARNENFKKKSRGNSVKRKLLGSRPSLNVNISKKVSSLHRSDDLTIHATISSHKKRKCIDRMCSSLRKFEKPGNNVSSLSPSYPSVPVRTSKSSSNERRVCHSYKPTRPHGKDTLSPIFQETSGSGISLNDSSFEENNISLNSSHENSNDDEIVDVMQIDELSQETIVFDSEPITTPESSVIFLSKHSSEKDELKTNLEQTYHKENIRRSADTPLNETKFSFTKAPKKGTLLGKAYKVVSTMKKDSALLSHEISVGLRTSRGTFVSDILFVNSICSEEGGFIIECTPLFNVLVDSPYVLDSPKAIVKLFIFTTALTKEIRVNSRLVVHFPVLAMFDASMKKIIVFTEDRIQVISTELSCSTHQCQSKMKLFASNSSKCKKIFRLLKSKVGKTVLDAVVGNLLNAHCILELQVLHIHKDRKKKQIILLAMDNEKQFSILPLGSSEILRVITKIQPDAVYIFVGFRLTKYFDLSREMKQAAEYYACGCIANEYMYVFEPVLRDFKINLVEKLEPQVRPWSSVNHFSFLNYEVLE